ncbi:hypothetical protein FV139_13770 [Parahaliea maris]|uniref:Uncharacterized protein n=1 Tax=Parahaliea maris TaxID=2716870 RepID=A0A5C8ZWR6_9GAMM|nr:hypothetical protein [Parahaliea maris]TXS93013.1 hypothetical protein FV139_13770 [Parahaliea maris]
MSAPASACGESLYRVGKGVAFREYSAPLPGRILALVTTESDRVMASILRDAGHDVHTVESVAQLGSELTSAEHEFDVVITLYEDHAAVQEEIAQARSGAAYLPVAAADSGQLEHARLINRDAPSTEDRVNTFLRAIHQTLVRRAPA